MKKVSIVSTGLANTASVIASFKRLGAEVNFALTPEEILDAQYLVLPGVGAFGKAISTLNHNNLTPSIINRLEKRLPTLAICLGLQLLFEKSEESPEASGLAVFPGEITRLRSTKDRSLKIPQLGWNKVVPSNESILIREGYAYFAHSFCLTRAAFDTNPSYTEYGQRFVSAFECGPILACQFHPELSGLWGRELLKRWLNYEKDTLH